MPSYTVAATAVTLGIPSKWVDNVLSHHEVPGVSQGRQGVSRRLAPQAVLTLDLTLRISSALGVPTSRALELSARVLGQQASTATIDLGQGVSLTIDLEEVRSELQGRLAHAVEVSPSPRRGRPAGP